VFGGSRSRMPKLSSYGGLHRCRWSHRQSCRSRM